MNSAKRQASRTSHTMGAYGKSHATHNTQPQIQSSNVKTMKCQRASRAEKRQTKHNINTSTRRTVRCRRPWHTERDARVWTGNHKQTQ
jgi:hypothetical protein